MKPSPPSKWVMVKGSGGGGLGDRLRAVLVGIAYARASGRGISVDWRDGVYADVGDNAFERLFQIAGLAYSSPQHLESCTDVFPRAWQGRLNKSMHEVYVEDGRPPWNRLDAIARYSFSLEHFEYSDDVLVMWEFDQLARLQQALGQPCDERMLETVLGAIWKGYLRSDPVVQQAVQPFLPQDDVFRIGVHVRATRESIQQKGVVALGDYFSPIDALIRQNENWELCLATDNQDVLKAFEDRYEPLVTWPKWFANVGDSLHLNPDCPNRLQAAQDALAEWLLLAASHYLITLNNSSFSQVARLMSGLPEQRQTRLASTPRGQSYRFRDSWKRLARWLRR